jgi:hypothetical protein
MAISEPTRAERWLYTRLTSDATLSGLVGTRVYANVGPDSAEYPFVTFTLMSAGNDVRGNGATIIWAKLTYLVKAVTKANSVTSLQSIADRINDALHAEYGATSDAAIDYCIRLRPFRMETVENNARYQHLGAEFELAVRAASV